jgi:hypothetical protein
MSNGHQIATTILEQLGGHQFIAMTGAKDFLHGDDYLQFRLPRGTANKATNVRIDLLPNDSGYKMTFYKVSKKLDKTLGFKTYHTETLKEFEAIPENMREAFTRETGLDCTLGTMGRK